MFYILDTGPLLVTQSIPSVLTAGSEHRYVDYSHEVKTVQNGPFTFAVRCRGHYLTRLWGSGFQ